MIINRKKILKSRDYLAEEDGAIPANPRAELTVALAYPNTYYLGMSNLGFQTVYALFNREPHTTCERVFLPDEAVLQSGGLPKPLRTLESGREVARAKCVAFSISFENDYLYFLRILDLANIPFYSRDRSESDPIILAGGAALTINPEPIADFCDAIFIGEAEEAVAEIAAVLNSGKSRSAKIADLARIEGVYLPAEMNFSDVPNEAGSICPTSPVPNSLENRVALARLRKYRRRVPENINGFPIETQIFTPYSEFGKLALIEVQRGCGRGCKFCAEGFIYTPFRQRDFDLIREQVRRGLKFRNKIGLIGADLLVYPQILELMKFIHAEGGTFSPSSVRVDAITDEIVEQLVLSGHKTLAIAPEAGSENLRRQVNKKFDNASILEVVRRLVAGGIVNLKMYIMMGLPGESDRDIDDLIELTVNVRDEMLGQARSKGYSGSLTLSLNPFIPKPRTPYQVGVFEGIESLEAKATRIRKKLVPLGGVKFYYENPFFSYVQALLSNGTRHMGDYLLEVFRNGGALKKSLVPFAGNDKKFD